MTLSDQYERFYQDENYFGYRDWIYVPYIGALTAAAGLARGSSVLDVGCGQGYFSNLLRESGMVVLGMDVSVAGIRAAQESYSRPGLAFVVADIIRAPLAREFDCVFARSLSLYNRSDFATNQSVTDMLLHFVRPGGSLIFVYNTKLRVPTV